MFATVLALAASLVVAPAQQSPAADLSVALGVQPAPVLLAGGRFDASVTNHGPDPLTSATVVVTFDHQASPAGATQQCPVVANTMTCGFGPVPVGGSATLSTFVYFLTSGAGTRIVVTATRTASTPPDPNTGNDTVTLTCRDDGGQIPPSPFPRLHC
jgi:hypothetical protein